MWHASRREALKTNMFPYSQAGNSKIDVCVGKDAQIPVIKLRLQYKRDCEHTLIVFLAIYEMTDLYCFGYFFSFFSLFMSFPTILIFLFLSSLPLIFPLFLSSFHLAYIGRICICTKKNKLKLYF